MSENKIKIYAQRQPHFGQGIELMIANGRDPAKLTYTHLSDEERCCYVPPTEVITNTAAQMLMDELWNCGIRPSEGTGSAGSLKATENHLDDMRKIAFKKLNID